MPGSAGGPAGLRGGLRGGRAADRPAPAGGTDGPSVRLQDRGRHRGDLDRGTRQGTEGQEEQGVSAIRGWVRVG